MKQCYRMCRWMLILSGILLGISFTLNCMNRSNVFVKFIIILITFSLSVLTKEIGDQYTSLEQHNLLSTVALSNIIKMLLIILQFYYLKVGRQWKVEVENLFLQCNSLDLVGMTLGCFLAKREVKSKVTGYLVTVTYLLIMVGCSYVEPLMIEKIWIYSLCISAIVIGSIVIVERRSIQAMLNEKNPYFIGLLGIMLVKQLMQYFLYRKWQQYSLFLINLEFLQATYLFYCTFYVCLQLPWQQRICALNEADKTLDIQSKRCDMIVNLSHELKTPVNVIRSALDILALDVKGTMKEEVRNIKKECNYIMNIIQDMIDIQKINTQHTEIKIQKYNLVEVFENVIDSFADQIEGCRLIFNPQEEEIDEEVDGLLMQQCFMILMGLLIQYDKTQEIYVEMEQRIEQHKICIKIISQNISYLRKLDELQSHMEDEEQLGRQIAQLLTLRLIYTLLEVQYAKLYFEEENEKYVAFIVFDIKQEGRRVWLDERNVAILNDQIRCRYIEG